MLKSQQQILDAIKQIRLKLDQCVASQQLMGMEGYRLLMLAVDKEISDHERRLHSFDCQWDETNRLRAVIACLDWFRSFTKHEAGKIADLAKKVEGLQAMSRKWHDRGIEPLTPEMEQQMAASVGQLKAELGIT